MYVCMYMNRWENEYKVFEYVDADWLKWLLFF
jgi:hypothetical protein